MVVVVGGGGGGGGGGAAAAAAAAAAVVFSFFLPSFLSFSLPLFPSVCPAASLVPPSFMSSRFPLSLSFFRPECRESKRKTSKELIVDVLYLQLEDLEQSKFDRVGRRRGGTRGGRRGEGRYPSVWFV